MELQSCKENITNKPEKEVDQRNCRLGKTRKEIQLTLKNKQKKEINQQNHRELQIEDKPADVKKYTNERDQPVKLQRQK